MRELSLHILDLLDNSIRAKASVVAVGIYADRQDDMLKVVIEDDGPGLSVTPEEAMDPFYTTKTGKKTGLGLSLFRATVERTGGWMKLSRSELGGLKVEAAMRLGHVDRCPLGDLPSSIAAVVCANPELDLRLQFDCGESGFSLNVRDVARSLAAGGIGCDGAALAQKVSDMIRAELSQGSLAGDLEVWSSDRSRHERIVQ